MQADQVKAEVLAYLRFIRRMPVVCTEAGPWNADVLALSAKTVVEVEVKTSVSDLRAEFRNKLSKHFTYGQATTASVPTFFYFAIPSGLVNQVQLYLEKGELGQGPPMPKAGLMVVDDQRHQIAGRNLDIAIRAQALHDRPPSKVMVQRALRRMASELVQLRLDRLGVYEDFRGFLRRLEHDHQVEALRLDGPLDVENPDACAQIRGREVALAVHPDLNWETLGEDGRRPWVEAAQRLWDVQYMDLPVWDQALRRV